MGKIKEQLQGQASSVKIPVGLQDGINVIADIENSRYVIETPNDYDVNYGFRSKNKEGNHYAEMLESPDRKKCQFAVPLDVLSSEEGLKKLNDKIRDARTSFNQKESEKTIINQLKEEMATKMSWEIPGEAKVILNFGPPTEKVKDKDGNVVKENGKDKVKPSFIGGEVIGYMKNPKTDELSSGNFFVLMGDVNKKGDIRYLRAIPSSNLLQAGEFGKRQEIIAEKFPVGSMRYIAFDEKYKASVIKEYTPKPKKEQTAEPAKQEQPDPKQELIDAQKAIDQLEEQSKEPGGIKLSDLAKAVQRKETAKTRAKSKDKEVARA